MALNFGIKSRYRALRDKIKVIGYHRHRNGEHYYNVDKEADIQAFIDAYDPLPDLRKAKITELEEKALEQANVVYGSEVFPSVGAIKLLIDIDDTYTRAGQPAARLISVNQILGTFEADKAAVNAETDPDLVMTYGDPVAPAPAPVPVPAPVPAPTGAAEIDYASRANAPGVIRAVNFNSPADHLAVQFPDDRTDFNVYDPDIKASGNGSVRFDIVTNSPQNCSGQVRIHFSDDPVNKRVSFGANERYELQWRQRFDNEMLLQEFLTTDGIGGWKQIIIGQDNGIAGHPGLTPTQEVNSCTEGHTVIVNGKYKGYPQAYHGCWSYQPYRDFINPGYTDQNEVVACRRSTPETCFQYRADEFMMFKVVHDLGPQGTAIDPYNGLVNGFVNSIFEFWGGYEGEPAVLLFRMSGLVHKRQNYADVWNQSAHDAEDGTLWLTNFITNKDPVAVHATASTWYDEIIISKNKIDDPGYPSIYSSIAPGTWAEISLNTLASIDPEGNDAINPNHPDNAPWHGGEGQKAVINDWNGGAFADLHGKYGSLLAFGGGHAAYHGNEVYAFDLETQRWSLVTEPTWPWDIDYANGELMPGEPMSSHTYDMVQYHPKTNSFLKLLSSSNHDQGGGGGGHTHALSLDTATWSRKATGLNTGDGVACSAWHRKLDIYWVVSRFNNVLQSYDPNTDTWASHGKMNTIIESNEVMSIDPDRDVAIICHFKSTARRVMMIDLSNPTAGETTVITAGDVDIEAFEKIGFEWCPPLKKFVAYNGRNNTVIWTLTTPANLQTDPWVWEKIQPSAANTVTPADQTGGLAGRLYSRWRWAPSIGCFLLVQDINGSVYAYRPEIT